MIELASYATGARAVLAVEALSAPLEFLSSPTTVYLALMRVSAVTLFAHRRTSQRTDSTQMWWVFAVELGPPVCSAAVVPRLRALTNYSGGIVHLVPKSIPKGTRRRPRCEWRATDQGHAVASRVSSRRDQQLPRAQRQLACLKRYHVLQP
jgi:hypothetical protein